MWYAPSVWLSIRLSEFKQYLSPLVNACAPSANLKNAVCEGRSVSRLSLDSQQEWVLEQGAEVSAASRDRSGWSLEPGKRATRFAE